MRKYAFLILATILLTAMVTPACARRARIEASLGQEFALYLDQTATINGENLEIRFADVISDSRCPQGVQCIWAWRSKLPDLCHPDRHEFRALQTGTGAIRRCGFSRADFRRACCQIPPGALPGGRQDHSQERTAASDDGDEGRRVAGPNSYGVTFCFLSYCCRI